MLIVDAAVLLSQADERLAKRATLWGKRSADDVDMATQGAEAQHGATDPACRHGIALRKY